MQEGAAESACTLKKGDRGGEEGQLTMMDQHLQRYSLWKVALSGPARSSVYEWAAIIPGVK